MTVLAEVKVVTADECGCDCEYRSNPAFHDQLLSIESLPPLEACLLIADLISDEEHHWVSDSGEKDELSLASEDGFGEPEAIGRFIAQHNWRDPVTMAHLAASVEYAAGQAWRDRRRDKSTT
jgi:hypothetical protein